MQDTVSSQLTPARAQGSAVRAAVAEQAVGAGFQQIFGKGFCRDLLDNFCKAVPGLFQSVWRRACAQKAMKPVLGIERLKAVTV